MIKQIGLENERKAMDVMTDNQLVTLENLLKEMDRRLSINSIDYSKGLISLNYLRNEGTPNEWVDENFVEVNVSMESIPCMIWEVVNKVWERVCR